MFDGVGPQLLSDVLAYNRYRSRIFEVVQAELAEAHKRPVVVAGLSLGGIIAVDYLSDRHAQPHEVGALVTMGSQAPFLYALDALEGLSYRHAARGKARPFTPWINVYNPVDLLSFVAEPVFANSDGIKDVATYGRQAFPVAHSVYWEREETWSAIQEAFELASQPRVKVRAGDAPDSPDDAKV